MAPACVAMSPESSRYAGVGGAFSPPEYSLARSSATRLAYASVALDLREASAFHEESVWSK